MRAAVVLGQGHQVVFKHSIDKLKIHQHSKQMEKITGERQTNHCSAVSQQCR